jgi:ATP-dependent Lhr-like helicase
MRAVTKVEQWFASHGWQPFAFQREVWEAYAAGQSGLIHAATGTGKTYAAWFAPLLEALQSGNPTKKVPGLKVLWITPLRALAADTLEALSLPVDELELNWRVETRTSDTTSAVRARQRKQLPSTLITTPESVSLLLSQESSAELFRELDVVIVDEWHELVGTKRGVQVELVLTRLRKWRPELRVWGLSATIGNLQQALHALTGDMPAERMTIIRGVEPKEVVIDALIPPMIERFPWAGHLGTQMLPQVIEAIEEGNSAIVFTNTRSQTEIWYQALLNARPDWAGMIALHHGSLDRKRRDWVEQGLRNGTLRAVVATSSLDLGVDFSPVDRVLQIGSPKGVARLLQRAGRSGHRPGAISRVTCVPTHTLELIEVAAARDGVERAAIESRYPVERPLDVLVQHAVTLALGGGFVASELLEEVRSTHAFADLSDAEWAWVLDFISHGGDALKAYPDYARTVEVDGRYVVQSKLIARRHRASIGTIVSDAEIVVQYLRGAALGSIEESFIARLNPGDKFFFAGKPLEFVRVRDMKAWVRRASSVKGAIPRWMGSRLPLSGELSQLLRERLGEAAAGVFRGPEMQAVANILKVQAAWSRIPAADEFLTERVKTREGHHLYFFPFEGRLVHEGLAALFAYRIAQWRPITFTMSSNDYGFELLSSEAAPLEIAIERGLFATDNLLDDITASLNAAEMAKRQFREIARVAGLVFPGFPRSGKTARQLQASSSLFYDVFQRYDPGNKLLVQAHREVLERQLESSRLGRTLTRLMDARVAITTPQRTPPLAFPLLVDRTRNKVSSETLADRIRRMQLVLEKAAG